MNYMNAKLAHAESCPNSLDSYDSLHPHPNVMMPRTNLKVIWFIFTLSANPNIFPFSNKFTVLLKKTLLKSFLPSLNPQWAEYVLFAGLLLAVTIIFAIMAYFYTYVDPAEIEAQLVEEEKEEEKKKPIHENGTGPVVQTQMWAYIQVWM